MDRDALDAAAVTALSLGREDGKVDYVADVLGQVAVAVLLEDLLLNHASFHVHFGRQFIYGVLLLCLTGQGHYKMLGGVCLSVCLHIVRVCDSITRPSEVIVTF